MCLTPCIDKGVELNPRCVRAALLFLLATLAFWSLVVWKLLWRSNIREGLRGQRDILRAAFADISHQTRVHLGYAAVMVKVVPPSLALCALKEKCPGVDTCIVLLFLRFPAD